MCHFELQVFHFCEKTELQSLTCPIGDAFNTLTSKCQPASTVACYKILQLGKKLPTVLIEKDEHLRTKRHVPRHNSQIDFAIPFLKTLIKNRIETVYGQNNKFINIVLLPTIFEMLDNPESRRDLYSAYSYAKTAFASIKWEVLRHTHASRNRGGMIPREYFDKAVLSFERKSSLAITKVVEKHLSNGVKRVYSNILVVYESMYELKAARYRYVGDLMQSVTKLISKHRILLKTSIATHANICSVPEFMNDIVPVRTLLTKVMVEYLYRNTYSFVKILYGENH